MTELQQNRYDQLMRRLGDLKGPGSKVSEVLTELFPVVDVERVPSELLALMGTRVAWGRVIVAAVAAQNSRAQLFNPAGSGKLITVTRLYPRVTVLDAVEMGTLGVALANLSAVSRYRDSRFGTTLQPVGQLREDTNVGATPATFRFNAQITESLPIDDENDIAVLSPGFGLVVSTASVNIGLVVSFMWRERTAEPSELNF